MPPLRQSRGSFHFLLAVAVSTALALAFLGSRAAAQQPIAGKSDIELGPYLFGWVVPENFTQGSLEEMAARKDPLRLFVVAFRGLVEYRRDALEDRLAASTRILDFMLEKYEPAVRGDNGIRWYYGNDHGAIKAPWWSGMDAMMGPMTFYAAYELTGNQRYRDEAVKSAKLVLTSPSDGGILWNENGKCWLSEYSWTGIQPSEEYHVLNGHLWALQSLLLLAKATGDAKLQSAYDCARDGVVAQEDRFYRANGTWTNYQTTPLELNPVHYNTLEHIQYLAMHALSGDRAYLQPAKARADIFAAAYPLSLIGKEGSMEVIFSMIGPPHPYWTDTYPVRVSCQVDGQTIERRNNNLYKTSVPLSERLIIKVPVGSRPTSCAVSVHTPLTIPMYERTEFSVEAAEAQALPLDGATAMLDAASIEAGKVQITPGHVEVDGANSANDEARIVLPLGIPVSDHDIIAFVVKTPQKMSLCFLMEDSEGRQATRYYLPLAAGKENIVMLNRLGFEKNDELGDTLRSIAMRIFTDPAGDDYEIVISDFQKLRSPAQISRWLEGHPNANFPQQ